jgi:hypothetical protein
MPARKLPALLWANRLLKTFCGRVIPSAARNLLLTLERLRDSSSPSPCRHDRSHEFFRGRVAAGLLCRPGAKTNAEIKPPLPRNSGCAKPIIKNTHNYRFFYGMNPIAIENKPLAKKRTQSNPINLRIFRRFCVGARLQPRPVITRLGVRRQAAASPCTGARLALPRTKREASSRAPRASSGAPRHGSRGVIPRRCGARARTRSRFAGGTSFSGR